MSEQNHPINELMSITMDKVKAMAGGNTIVGEPIRTDDGVTLIPVSKVSMGFASGGADFNGKTPKADGSANFGGGAGAGVNIAPVAFLVVKDGHVRLLPVAPPPATTVDRVVEMVPEMFDRVTEFIDKNNQSEDKDII